MPVCRIVDRPHDDGAPQGGAHTKEEEHESFHSVRGVGASRTTNLTMNGHAVPANWISAVLNRPSRQCKQNSLSGRIRDHGQSHPPATRRPERTRICRAHGEWLRANPRTAPHSAFQERKNISG